MKYLPTLKHVPVFLKKKEARINWKLGFSLANGVFQRRI
jgi:hypothetical protein